MFSESYLAGYSHHEKGEEKEKIEGTLWKSQFRFYDWRNQPYIPVEFSVAAYRFGHSMVRPFYRINDQLGDMADISIFKLDVANNEDLAQSLEKNGIQLNDTSMAGFKERPLQWDIDWARFFNVGHSEENLQFSKKINTKLALGLGNLPFIIDGHPSLAARNLIRSQTLQLPSGQSVAKAMGLPEEFILTNEIASRDGTVETPLWFYILKEAEDLSNGNRLGPVGGRIVAEVLIGLLVGDPSSYINQDTPWKPEIAFGALQEGDEIRFGIPELLKFAGVV